MTIKIDVVADESGEVLYAFPSEASMAHLTRLLERRATEHEAAGERDEASAIRAEIEASNAQYDELRRTAGPMIETRTFPLLRRPSMGDTLHSRREATTFEGGQPRFDNMEYGLRLAARCLGIEYDALLAMSPIVAPILVSEVVAMTQTDPDRLDFLLRRRRSSEPVPSNSAARPIPISTASTETA